MAFGFYKVYSIENLTAGALDTNTYIYFRGGSTFGPKACSNDWFYSVVYLFYVYFAFFFGVFLLTCANTKWTRLIKMYPLDTYVSVAVAVDISVAVCGRRWLFRVSHKIDAVYLFSQRLLRLFRSFVIAYLFCCMLYCRLPSCCCCCCCSTINWQTALSVLFIYIYICILFCFFCATGRGVQRSSRVLKTRHSSSSEACFSNQAAKASAHSLPSLPPFFQPLS